MQIQFNEFDFHIFIVEFVEILFASWAMGNSNYLETGRKKLVESVKFIKIKGPRKAQGPEFDEKFLPGGRNLTKLENLRQSCGGM